MKAIMDKRFARFTKTYLVGHNYPVTLACKYFNYITPVITAKVFAMKQHHRFAIGISRFYIHVGHTYILSFYR
jgi:hypothetical protein